MPPENQHDILWEFRAEISFIHMCLDGLIEALQHPESHRMHAHVVDCANSWIARVHARTQAKLRSA